MGITVRITQWLREAHTEREFWDRVHLDPLLLVLLLAVLGGGLVVLYSAGGSYFYTERQAARLVVGLVALVIMAQIDPRWLRAVSPMLYVGGVILLGLVLVAGTGAMGATRWLSLFGVFSFQPSEILKVATPGMIAWYLSRHPLPPGILRIGASLLLCLLPAVLIIQQPDLGTALLIIASGVFAIFLAGLSWWYIFGGILLAVSLFPVAWVFLLRDYQKERILTLFDPHRDPLGAGWNIIQSQTAIGSGGWSGKGFLQGTQSQLNFLPESHTDFIVAVLAEEFGFVGMLLLLLLYLAIALRGLIIVMRARNTFGRLLGGALIMTFFIYVLVNVGMVSGLLPVVGVPLPLISYGGTSMVTLLAGFGIIMSVATHRQYGSR